MATVREELMRHVTQAQMSAFFIDKMKVYNVKSYGAKGDGTTDDTAAIQATIDDLPSTGGIVFVPGGVYIVSANIKLPSHTELYISKGATIKIKNSLDANINVITNSDTTDGNTNIRITGGGLIDGNQGNQASGTQAGIYLKKVTYSTIEGIRTTACRHHGIALDTCTEVMVNKTVDYSNGESGGGGQGIILLSCIRCIITNNDCYDNFQYNIRLETSDGNIISNNVCKGSQQAIRLYDSDRNIVEGNFATGGSAAGVGCYFGLENIFTGNRSTAHGEHGIFIEDKSHRNLVANNYTYENNYHGIVVSDSDENIVTGNYCFANGQAIDNSYSNIYVNADADYNQIHGNICRRGSLANKPAYGVRIHSTDCNANFVTNNDLYDSGTTANLSDNGTGTVTAAGNRV